VKAAALLLAPLALLAQTPGAGQRPCDRTPAYSACEMVFDLGAAESGANPNPYATVDLRIELRSPRHKTYAIPGYWDGGSRMAVRIAPTEPGDWDYRITSNIQAWNGREGSFTAAPSNSPGFIRPALLHHWAYTEPNLAHFWMGITEPGFASMDDQAFRAMADAKASRKFTHVRGLILGAGALEGAGAGAKPNPSYFQKIDARVRYLNQKGIVADLVLADSPSAITAMFPDRAQRQRFIRYLAARYAGMNITWQGVSAFEDERDGRGVMKEIGGWLKEADGYGHPRTSGANVTSAPMLDDGWMDMAVYGSGANNSVGAVERQLYGVPALNTAVTRGGAAAQDAAARFRSRLWNAAMNGQYVSCETSSPEDAQAMTAFYDLFSASRHWELEPYFDVDNGRALALEDSQYIIYVEKPGHVEALVEKRSYEVQWIDPANGKVIRSKFKGDRFAADTPDQTHDWVLHLVREGRLESLARSYKFESRIGEEGSRAQPIVLQEIEMVADKVPFEVEAPDGDVSATAATAYSAKIKRQTRATSAMTWLWTAQVTSEPQGYRVVGTDQKGELRMPPEIAASAPATLLLRIYGMNANGKVYELTRGLRLTK
jgi:hypothetical protein